MQEFKRKDAAGASQLPNGQILDTLHDFSPRREYKKRLYAWLALILLIYLGMGVVAIALLPQHMHWSTGLFITLFVVLIPVTAWAYLLVKTGSVATNWDDLDYTGLEKRDLTFTSTDGVKHFAYIYYPEEMPPKSLEIPAPAIIGLHGWGSHHREMDRYCLPTVRQDRKYLYFSFDAYGQGQTHGDKNDLRQIDHAREFIDLVYGLPYVDTSKVIVVGMSLGSAKAAVVAYPNPKVRGLIMLSGPFNLVHTQQHMTVMERFLFWVGGFKLSPDQEVLDNYSGIRYFKPEGVILEGTTVPTPNFERVFLLANRNDPTVKVESTLEAIQRLGLPPENYRLYPQGRHTFEGNEYYVALDIYFFIQRLLSL